jgi:hypothetical protein
VGGICVAVSFFPIPPLTLRHFLIANLRTKTMTFPDSSGWFSTRKSDSEVRKCRAIAEDARWAKRRVDTPSLPLHFVKRMAGGPAG